MEVLSTNEEIEDFISQVKEDGNGNHLILGEAGSGKTEIIRRIMEGSKDVVCLAPTGIASNNITDAGRRIFSQTIHRFFHLSTQISTYENIRIYHKSYLLYRQIRTLIIDEISMVRSDVFNAIDLIMRKCGDADRPFGGKQVLIFGDYRQLPPVVDDPKAERYLEVAFGGRYAFQTEAWKRAELKVHLLNTSFRHRDEDFRSFLHKLHEGHLDMEAARRMAVEPNNLEILGKDMERVCLCSRRANAYWINGNMLDRINGEEIELHGSVAGVYPDSELPTELHMKLKIGCKVMTLVNSTNEAPQNGYVNGSMATVIAKGRDYLVVRTADGNEHTLQPETWTHWAYELVIDGDDAFITQNPDGYFTQFPVQIAYGMTIHKSQGLTLKKAYLDIGYNPCFASGQLYTALSRVHSFQDIMLNRQLSQEDVKVDAAVEEFYEQIYH